MHLAPILPDFLRRNPEVEIVLDRGQRMTSLPNPLAHRTSAYLNYLYRALPEAIREKQVIYFYMAGGADLATSRWQ